MEKEQSFVVDSFCNAFLPYKEKKILLYGIGRNTEAIIDHAGGFQFLGLMDQNAVGQTIYGYPVLSEEQAIDGFDDDRIIVIIARESVIGIIFKRIEHLYLKHGIRIYDYSGRDLSENPDVGTPSDIPYWHCSYEDLCHEIEMHEVVSFDIFDTLLMRRVLDPKDIFLLVEEKTGIQFAEDRIRAEKNLDKNCPDLDRIYQELGRITDLSSEKLEELKETEKKVDKQQLIIRPVMRDALRYALDQGKKVYILSDMYYPSDYLEQLLKENDIIGYQKILVSCELGCTKEEGEAYEAFKEIIHADFDDLGSDTPGSLLHIGDNRYADIESAEKRGLDTFQVMSAYELFMASSLQGLLVDTASLGKRCLLGLLAAKLFLDPFAINKRRGAVAVSARSSFGYVFIAPMLEEFTRWMMREAANNDIDTILFASRDGRLIQKIYQQMGGKLPSEYFRASRRALTVSTIHDRNDIERIAGRVFTGSFSDMLRERFGIDDAGERSLGVKELAREKLLEQIMDWEEAIFQEAEIERKSYLRYLQETGITKGSCNHAALFDMVTSGTIPYCFSKLIGKDLPCFCFATLNLPNEMYGEDNLQLRPAYGNIQSYGNATEISKHYLVLESILTDERSTFVKIKEDGTECFMEDGINHQFDEISEIWDGILGFCDDHRSLYGDIDDKMDIELTLTDQIFGEAFSERNDIAETVRSVFCNDDAYDGIKEYSVWK